MNLFGPLARRLAGAGLPALAGAVAGPAGAIVAAQVAKRLGLPGANPEALEKALTADPSLRVKLAELEVAMAAETNRTMEIEAADRADARANNRDDGMRRILALALPVAALGFGGCLVWWLVNRGLATEAIGMAGMVLGWLIRDASAATAYFFGTSVGSSRKSKELAAIERKTE